jgi:hypothetical protein
MIMRVVALSLGLSLGALAYSVVPAPSASANLRCTDLKACAGDAQCVLGGNPTGCTISCTGGGEADCIPAG